MRQNNTYKFKITTILVAIIICVLVIYLHLLSHNKTEKIYLEQTEKIIIDMKKEFLKDTVNNVFIEIDKLRESKAYSYEKNTEHRLTRLQDELDLEDDEFISFFIDKFKNDQNSDMWTALLIDNKTGKVLYASPDLNVRQI